MRATNTFSVIFWPDQNSATNNEALIYARVTVNQKRVNISLKRKVSMNLLLGNLAFFYFKKQLHNNTLEAL